MEMKSHLDPALKGLCWHSQINQVLFLSLRVVAGGEGAVVPRKVLGLLPVGQLAVPLNLGVT